MRAAEPCIDQQSECNLIRNIADATAVFACRAISSELSRLDVSFAMLSAARLLLCDF